MTPPACLRPMMSAPSPALPRPLLSLGLRYMALSAFFFSLMSLTVKIAGQRLPTMELVFARAVVVSAFAYADILRRGVSLRGQQPGMLMFRGLVGFGALACFYYSVVHLPLAEATVIHFTNPVFTALIAVVFLGERLSLREVLLALVSLAGVALVVRPAGLFGGAGASLPALPVASALSGAFLAACAYVIVRHLRRHDAMVVVFYFAGLSSVAALPFMLPDMVWPRGSEWLVLLGVGVSTFLGQVFLTLGLQRERAARATAMGYLQIVFASLWGALFFSVAPGPGTVIGAVVIVGTALLLGHLRERSAAGEDTA